MAAAPEVLARHLDAAGDHAAAAASWLRAGATALRAPAYVEAMAHYEAGLRALQSLPGGAPQTLELDLQLGLGSARMAALGYSAEATQAAYARAEHLSGELEDSARLAPALYGLAVYACAHGEQRRCRDLGLRLRRIAEAAGDTDTALEADVLLAISSCLRGEFEDGLRSRSTRARRLGSRAPPRPHVLVRPGARASPRTRRTCSCSAGPGTSTRRGARAPTACASRAGSATRCLSHTCSPA